MRDFDSVLSLVYIFRHGGFCLVRKNPLTIRLCWWGPLLPLFGSSKALRFMGSEGHVVEPGCEYTRRGAHPNTGNRTSFFKLQNQCSKQGPEPSSPLMSPIAPGDKVVHLIPAYQINLMFTMALLSSEKCSQTPALLTWCLLPYVIT